MKTRILLSLAILVSMLTAPDSILAQGTAFTYHGRLADSGSNVNGSFDLTFSLFDADMGNNQIGNTVTNTAIPVSGGLFVATLDFGSGIFTGPERWLEIAVRTNGLGGFTTLSPRQRLTPTPYAMMANTASNLLGVLPAGQLNGTLTDGQLPPNLARLNNDATFTGALTLTNPANRFTGDGSGLASLNASQLTTGILADARLSSNVALLNIHQTFSGSNLFSGVVQLTNTDNTFVGNFTGNGGTLTALNPTNLAAGTAAIDISGHAATAASAGSAPWAGIIGIPAGFADGLDQDTLYSPGIGLNLNGTEFSVSFGGSGVAGSAARGDHDHNSLYAGLVHNHDATYSLLGHGHAATDLTSGTLADARLSSNVALLNVHQTFSGSNVFSGVVQLTNTDNTFAGTFTGSGAGLSGLNPMNLAPGIAAIDISGNAATATSAVTATTATTASTATNFSGLLFGDVTGTQSATVVTNVGGLSAVQVASGAGAANAATPANTPDTLVRRDSAGSFMAGVITATNFTGSGSSLTELNASALASGTINDQRLSSNVALLNTHQTFSGSNLFSGVVQLTNTDNLLSGTFTGIGTGLTLLNPASLAPGTAAIDISGNAASATTATTASAAPWSGITGMPAGFADGLDNDTLYSAGLGLNLNGTEFGVSFGGNGVAGNAARSDHNHDSLYAALAHNHDASYSLLGHVHAAADLTSGTLADERLSINVALLNGHQTFSGSNLFVGITAFTNATNTFVGTFAGDGAGLSNLVVVAGNVAGPIPAEQLSGTLPSRLLAGSYSNAVTFNNPANSFIGSGAGLSGVNAAALGGLGASDFWQLGGNAGTIAGVDFLGTTDDQPLELKVNNIRALRLEPNANGAPNIIGGAPVNFVAEGVMGATISGGGTAGGMSSNSISSDFGTVAGGSGNSIQTLTIASADFASINGGQGNFINGAPRSVISGGANNVVFSSPYFFGTDINSDSVISGGRSNSVEAPYSTIGGGMQNRVIISIGYNAARTTNGTIAGGISNMICGSHSTIGGGRYNKIRVTGEAPPPYSSGGGDCTIGGGSFNTLKDFTAEGLTGATIAGGTRNAIAELSDYSFIGGGSNNLISYYASLCVISGGGNNTIEHGAGVRFSTIGGGSDNSVLGIGSAISGGVSNTVRISSSSSIGGGSQNSIIGAGGFADSYCTVGGGSGNRIAGAAFATIPGGVSNTVQGYYAFAAGRRAKATQPGVFVWADSTDLDYDPYAYPVAGGNTNSFNVRASGGLNFVTAVDGATGQPTSGLYVSAGGSGWNTYSDRNAKTNFAAVDGREILRRLEAIPITSWNYKTQDPSKRHIGPMAQDFNAAFEVGEADKAGEKKHIHSLDVDGVALAAIQGLNEVVKEQQAALKQKDTEIQSLQQRLEALERAILGRETVANGGGQ